MTQRPYAPPPVPPAHAPQAPGRSYEQMPPAPEKKPFYKKKWFLVVAAIAIIAPNLGGGTEDTGGAAQNNVVDTSADGAAPAAEAAPEETDPGIGEPAADGDFSFVVSGVDCSLTEIGDQYTGTKAQGQFCVVGVGVTNIGDEPGTFFGENAKLFNAEGQEYTADTEAAIYLEDSASLLEEINPGNTLDSKVVFDVPAGTVPASIELHDPAFSGGVTVALQ